MLLDSAALYFRAFYGIPPDSMTAPDGTPVNAVRGLLDMIARLIRAYRPGRLVACMDADWRPAFRVAAIPSYKAHRANPDGTEQVPDALSAQIPVIEQVLTAAGVVMAGARGYEADDIIGTLAARDDGPVDVVTGDRDLFQLVDDARQVRVIYTARGMSRLEVVDEAAVTRRYQIPGRAYAAFAALQGYQAGVVFCVSGAQRPQRRVDGELRIGDAAHGARQGGQALVEGPVPALDKPVTIEQQQIVGGQRQDRGRVLLVARAEQDADRRG